MEYIYSPVGVCSQKMIFDIDNENNKINSLKVIGGCDGNLKGINALITGMDIDEVIKRLSDIKCRIKETSCPDQIAQALIQYKNNNK